MEQNWILNIRNFGKIEEGRIEIAPFLIFVGENNSGKSYLMSLLWGLLAVGRRLFPKNPPSTEAYLKCKELIDEIIKKNEYELKAEDNQIFIDFFNSLLREKRGYFLRQVFSTDLLRIDELKIINYKRQKPLKIRFEEDNGQRFSSGKNYVQFPINKFNVSNFEKYKIIQYILWKLLMEDLGAPLFSQSENKRGKGEPLFLPASRTGFMLAYKSLTSDVMSAWGYEEEVDSKFTLPMIRFLQSLVSQEEKIKINKYKNVIDYIENDILNGKIIIENTPIKSYKYTPKGLKKDFPLFITSSLVVELSPLSILLKSNLKFKSLIIEEIEAHLHPAIQRAVTRAIIQLVNAGLPVWITTHSDIVFQHINNMIKLSNIKDNKRKKIMEELKYNKNDLLKLDKVRAYEFEVREGKTKIKALKSIENRGFEIPTFNRVLIELYEEANKLDEALEDDLEI